MYFWIWSFLHSKSPRKECGYEWESFKKNGDIIIKTDAYEMSVL